MTRTKNETTSSELWKEYSRYNSLRSPQACGHDVLKVKLELAEEALRLSNQNVELTMRIFLTQGAQDIAPLLAQRVENSARISNLIHDIEKRINSEKERELLDAASADWSSAYTYQQVPHPLPPVPGRAPVNAEKAMLNVMLPLLLDNYSWKAFVEFLRAQMDLGATVDEQLSEEMADWVRDLVCTDQKIKSRIVELDRMQELLSQLTSIIELSNDAIIVQTLNGTIVSWNKGAERIYGYSAGEVLGRSRRILVPDGQTDDLSAVSEKLKRGDAIQSSKITHRRKDGQMIRLSTTMSPVKDASGAIVGAAAITRELVDSGTFEEQIR